MFPALCTEDVFVILCLFSAIEACAVWLYLTLVLVHALSSSVVMVMWYGILRCSIERRIFTTSWMLMSGDDNVIM